MAATSPRVEILYFTDPFCSWCWALEPVLYRIKETYRDQVRVRTVMGGLVEDIANFLDAANGISGTADVAPHWEHVAQVTGQPIDGRFMRENTDPHWGTWPACTAASTAALQGPAQGEAYLRRLRRAAQAEGRNASDPAVYMAVAAEAEGLDLARFEADLASGEGARAFQEDRILGARYGVRSFPTLIIHSLAPNEADRPLLVNGARDFDTLRQVLLRVDPSLEAQPIRSVPELLAAYGPLTTRELAELHGEATPATLEALRADGVVRSIPVKGGEFWELGAAGPQAKPARIQVVEVAAGEGLSCDLETGICG
ncbi:MAG TPA: DsbA family protein [Pantanalinema sp.]